MHRRREGLYERELPGELILYDPECDRAFLLNQTAAAVWDLCDGATSVEQMAREISASFSISQERALEDARTTVANLEREGLLSQVAALPGTELP